MVAFIDDYRSMYGFKPIRRRLPIRPSAYSEQKAKEREFSCRSAPAPRGPELPERVARV